MTMSVCVCVCVCVGMRVGMCFVVDGSINYVSSCISVLLFALDVIVYLIILTPSKKSMCI